MPDRELGERGDGSATDRLLGEVIAEVRALKHGTNNTATKVDALAGKVDGLALVVAAQGHLREDVDRLEKTVDELKADKLRREGAIGLFEWVSRHWPFALVSALLAAIVAWANGRLG